MDHSEFAQPGLEYRGVTLWMMNDKLERDECARQIRGFAEAGWGALITRTFNGLRTEYLSEAWMEIIRETIAVAGELGLKVWLQAGYMPSAIPDLEDEHTHRVLVRRGRDEGHPARKRSAHLARQRQRQPRLADATRPGQGQQAHSRAGEQVPRHVQLALPPDQRCQVGRQGAGAAGWRWRRGERRRAL